VLSVGNEDDGIPETIEVDGRQWVWITMESVSRYLLSLLGMKALAHIVSNWLCILLHHPQLCYYHAPSCVLERHYTWRTQCKTNIYWCVLCCKCKALT
jgi:hypothetical protein